MAAKQQTNDSIPGLLRRLLGESQSSTALFAISIMLVGLAAGTYILWGKFGAYVMGQPEYRLTVESIESTPQPAWIVASDVREESAVSGGLKDLHIRQPDLTLRVAQAFSMHPWGAKSRSC